MKLIFKLSLFTCFFSLILQSQNLDIYVSDAGGFNNPNPPWQILKYDSNGENPQVFIDEELAWPQEIVFLEATNTVIISNLNSGRITKHDATTGNFIEDFAFVAGGPTRMKIGDDGLLYVIQWSLTDNNVLRYDLDGNFVDEFTTSGVPRSIGMDWDSNGNLYVSSFQGFVQKFDPTGNDLGVFIDSELQGPTNIWIDSNDHVFVIDWSAGDIEEFDSNGDHVDVFIDGLTQPEGIAFYENGNMLIGNGGGTGVNGSVKHYESNGTFINDIVTPGSGGLAQTNAVVLRDPTLSIEENFLEKTTFMLPTIGRSFVIQKPENLLDSVLSVYTIHGKLVDIIEIKNQTVWNANQLSEGIYFVTLHNAQQAMTQKIVVKD